MKKRDFAILILLSLATAATGDETPEPALLSALRTNWKQAVERSAEPLNATYLAELEKLKPTFSQNGDSKAVTAVETEIERFILKARFEDQIVAFDGFEKLEGVWDWNDSAKTTLTINSDGTGSHSFHGKFEVQRIEPTAIEVIFPDSQFAPLPFRFQWKSKDKLERIRLSTETNEHIKADRGDLTRKK